MAQDIRAVKPFHTLATPKREVISKSVAQRPTRRADDATGINVADRKPINSKMPNLPPA